jgi:hypothetical protein
VTAGVRDEELPGADVDQRRAAALLSVLWDNRTSWQHRVIYKVELGTTTHGRVTARYHVVVRREHVQATGFSHSGDSIRALVPLTWRPKELLLNLALTSSSEEPVHLLTRADAAGLQAAQFLDSLLSTPLVLRDTDGIWDLVEAIARFMPRRARAAADLDEESSARQTQARLRDPEVLARFITGETGVGTSPGDTSRWAGQLRAVEALIAGTQSGNPSAESSAENFILALSELQVHDVSELDAAVDLYRWLVLTLSACQERHLLQLLGRLGREWTVVCDTQVSIDRPMSLTMSDDRPLQSGRGSEHVLYMPVPLEDGESLHVETQLSDPSTLLLDVKLVALDGATDLPLSDDVRETHDRHAVYLSTPGRPPHGLLRIKIGLASDVQRTNRLVFALSAVALVLVSSVNNSADILALLVIPATLAVSVVQVRDSTSIARRLTSRARVWLFGIAAALWLVAGLRLLIQSEGEAGLLDLFIHLGQEER